VYQANEESLKKITASLDNLTAFENTSLKNLKMFTDLAAKMPDTGIPWLNTPVRLLDEKLVGRENMAVANAARQIGLREIARITNDPKMSGELSDSARKEVMGLSQQNATLPQILAVAKIVRTDVETVHQSLSDQRDAIAQRIKGGDAAAAPAGAAQSGAPKATHRFNPATGRIEEIKGAR
jgi:glyceraldehyde-3-phosphate dehydrogenase/erythrose-4-phosphate dehydrogenase